MVWFSECYKDPPLVSAFIIVQAGVASKWTNDSQHFLLEHFDTINNSPSHIYHSALPFAPSSSWLHKGYSTELSHMVKVVKGLPAEWGKCSRTVVMNSPIWTVSYHNNTIAIGSEPGDIIILNSITGSQTAVLSGHTKEVTCVVFSSDGTSLVSGSFDMTVRLWDVQTGRVVRTFSGHTHVVWSVSISADCTAIASGSYDMTICLWDIQTGECHYTIRQQGNVRHVMFSPTNPQYLISICQGKVWHWDTNGHQIKPPCDGSCIAFSTNGNHFISCNGVAATIQNSDSGVIVATFHMVDSNARYCCFSPDDKLVAVAAGHNAYIWDITSSEPHLVETFTGHANSIASLAFSSPSSLISVSDDKSVKFWQIDTSPIASAAADPGSAIWSASPHAGGWTAISSDVDGVVKTWDISTGLCKASFQTPAKTSDKRDVLLINGQLVIAWYAEGKIKAWDAEKGELLLEVDGPGDNVSDLRISNDGSNLFCVVDENIQAWSIWTGETVGKVESGDILGGICAMDGSRVWIDYPDDTPVGWDFRIPGSSPIRLSTLPPDVPHPNGTNVWDSSLSRVKDTGTRKVIFQLPKGLGRPVYVQWNGQYLAAYLRSREVLILEFPPTFLP